MRFATALLVFGAVTLPGQPLATAAQTAPAVLQPPRDTPAQTAATVAAGTAKISGQVVAADSGRPVARARVQLGARELPGGRTAVTDEDGRFTFAELPAGRYTLSASKSGFVTLAYGQRRPQQPGTPLQLADGAGLTTIHIRLPRGSVISGHVFDEDGEPMPGTAVRAMRYQFSQGTRQLMPAGFGQTDDRGQYRIWGLNPGDYYVSAVARNVNVRGRPLPGRGGRGAGPGAAGLPGATVDTDAADHEAYAPTFYPGVSSPNEARPVSVGLGEEALNVDFMLTLVRTARVSGRAVSADGSAISRASVTLVPEGQIGRGGPGLSFGGRVGPNATFSVANVPPGRYTLIGRGTAASSTVFASQPLAVAGTDIEDLLVVLGPGATLSGAVEFRPTQAAASPDARQVRVLASPMEPGATASPARARPDQDGRFTLQGVPAGRHWLRAEVPSGWMLHSVLVAGREMIDEPLEVRTGQRLGDISLLFTDRLTEISGQILDARGGPVSDYTVLAFPTDPSLWHPQARHIATARPDQNGRYLIRGVPPGSYYVTTIDPVEPGEWFDPAVLERHQAAAARVVVGDGELRTQDFRLAPR